MLVYTIENVKRSKVQLRVVVVISFAPASTSAIIHLCVGIEKGDNGIIVGEYKRERENRLTKECHVYKKMESKKRERGKRPRREEDRKEEEELALLTIYIIHAAAGENNSIWV